MPSFEDLGLREELLRVLDDEDIESPTDVQGAIIPAMRRGTNVIARAGTGSGKTLAYLLGVLDRLGERRSDDDDDAGSALRALVITATYEQARSVALTAFPYAQAVGVDVAVAGGAWGTPASGAALVVAPVADTMDAVRNSALKLDAVQTVVVDGAALIHGLGDWDQVDGLLDLVPRDAQRVLISADFPDAIQDLVERRVRKALSYPVEPALRNDRPGKQSGQVGYVLVGSGEKLDLLVRQLAAADRTALPSVIYCRNDERAAVLAEQLSVRGFAVGAVDDDDADVAIVAGDADRARLMEEGEGELGQTVSYDVPADRDTLVARHAGDDDAVVLVEPRQLAHLKEIGAMARFAVRTLPVPPEDGAAASRLNAFRHEIRRAIEEQDISAQMLVLEPLFAEFSAAEVAAAASALLRRREPAVKPGATTAGQPESSAAASTARATSDAGPAPSTWTRLYVSLGALDEVRPGDLVGALAGEANIPGSRIGKIEVRDSFSIVEVEAAVADKVIRAVNGTTIKGRSVRVDFDRGGERGRHGSPQRRGESDRGGKSGGADGGRSGGARRTVRRPPAAGQ